MSYNIGPITNSLLNSCVQEFNKKETRDKILNNVITPLINDLSEKYGHYMAFLFIALVIIIILQCVIIKLMTTSKDIIQA